jgi:hypothetical protein
MKSIFALTILLLSTSFAQAQSLTCFYYKTDAVAPSYKVEKTGVDEKATYKLIKTTANKKLSAMTFPLVETREGDEDYTNYKVTDAGQAANVMKISIQDDFEWADLVDTKGVNFAHCQP